MPRFLIAVTDSPFPSLDPAKAALARVDPELRMAKSASADDILAVARDADAILVTYANLSGDLLRQLTRCKAIGRFGLGVDNIDLPAAKECSIAVNYVPDYCLREVSDHAMALLLALARKIPFSNRLVQSGRWEVPPIVPHLGSATTEVRDEMANIVVDNIVALLEGRRPPNIVNPQVLEG